MEIYVCSIKEISPLDYVDKESIGHPCVTSRHRDDVFSEYKHYPGSACGCLPEEQRAIVDMTVEFCKMNNLEYEIFDIANLSLMKKLKLVLKGIKAPTVAFRGKKLEEILSTKDLKSLIPKRSRS